MLSKLRPVGIAIALVVTLIFVGTAFLEAKKPVKPPPEPEWEWTVEIPGWDQDDWNLFAATESGEPFEFEHSYRAPNLVRVDLSFEEWGFSRFRLWIYQGYDREFNDDLIKIGFQWPEGALAKDLDNAPTGNGACNFPGSGYPCLPEGEDPGPGCMEDFLVNNAHPYTGANPAEDYVEYRLFIDVVEANVGGMDPCDPGNADCDGPFPSDEDPSEVGFQTFHPGHVYFEYYKSFDNQIDGCDDFHGVGIIDAAATIWIRRTDTDECGGVDGYLTPGCTSSWEIVVDDPEIPIFEAYEEGKKSVVRYPIRAVSPFRFTGTWTRFLP